MVYYLWPDRFLAPGVIACSMGARTGGWSGYARLVGLVRAIGRPLFNTLSVDFKQVMCVRITYAWMLPGFIAHVGLVYALSSLETVWYLMCVA